MLINFKRVFFIWKSTAYQGQDVLSAANSFIILPFFEIKTLHLGKNIFDMVCCPYQAPLGVSIEPYSQPLAWEVCQLNCYNYLIKQSVMNHQGWLGQPSSRIQLFDVMVMIIDGGSPQSACSEPAASCTGLGLRGFCIHGQPAQLSALLRPKISERGSRDGCKRLRIHKKGDPARGPCQQNVQAIFRSMQASCGMAGLSLLWRAAT